MQCRQCGAEIADGNKFCPECGAMQNGSGQPAQPVYPQQEGNYAPPQYASAPPQYTAVPPQYAGAPQRKKSVALPILIVCAVAVLAILLVLIFLPRLLGTKPSVRQEESESAVNATSAASQENALDPGEINSHELTAEQSGAVLERLRGVWLNDKGDNMIGFLQEGGDADHEPGWTMFTGAPNAGYDWSGAVQMPLYGDPNGIVRVFTRQPEYTDLDGEYHPATELNFYVDLSMRNDNSISWTNAGDKWERCSFYAIHPEYINGQDTANEQNGYADVLTQEQTDDLLESLRGVWMNADRDYFLAFCQEDSDTWEASFGPPFSEYDFSGYVSRTVCRNSRGTIRLTVTGADLNGGQHEVSIYLDVSHQADNNVRWCTDEEKWESCDLFCMGVEQIPDRLS